MSRQRVEDLAATVLAAEAAGLARWTLQTATEYAKVREQFGKPIGSFQAIKHMCAEMLLRSEQVAVAAGRRRARRRTTPTIRSCRSPPPSRPPSASRSPRPTPRTASRCSAASASPGSTTRTCTCAAHTALRSSSAAPSRWLRRVAALTQHGVRRELHIDLASVEHLQPEIAAAVAEVAALPDEKRQIALAEAGLQAPHWPRPYGRDASPAEQLLIDREMAAAGVERPDLVIGWWAAPTILEHGSPEQIERFVPADAARRDRSGASCSASRAPARTWRRCGPKPFAAEGGWKLTGQKVWTSRGAQGAVGRLPGPHRPRRAEAQGHHLLPRRHDVAGHRHPAAAGDHRRRSVQRGVLRRRVRARRDGGRRGQRRLAAGAHHAGQRARRDGARHRARQPDGRAAAHGGRARARRRPSRTGSAG